MTLNADVRQRLDAHLDAVEKALVEAHCSRERRRGVVDDLEAQITDMLAARTPEPTLADLEAVLATLDPPAAYGNSDPAVGGAASMGAAGASGVLSPGRSAVPLSVKRGAEKPVSGVSRLSGMAVAGLVCNLVSLLGLAIGMFFVAAGAYEVYEHSPFAALGVHRIVHEEPQVIVAPQIEVGPNGRVDVIQPAQPTPWRKLGVVLCAMIVPGVLGVLGTVLGWMAFVRIRASNGALYGRGLALFDGLLYPVKIGLLLFILMPLPMLLLILVAGGIVLYITLSRRSPARA